MKADSKIEAFEAELKSIGRVFNVRLFVFLAIMLPVSFLYDRSSFKSGYTDIAFVLIFGGAILSFIIGIAKAKNRVCEKNGLVCPHCCAVPKAFYAVNTMCAGVCPRCKQKMSTQLATPPC